MIVGVLTINVLPSVSRDPGFHEAYIMAEQVDCQRRCLQLGPLLPIINLCVASRDHVLASRCALCV